MKKCKACQAEIGEAATKCQFCRTDQRGLFGRHPIYVSIILLVFVMFISSLFREQPRSRATGPKAEEGTGLEMISSKWDITDAGNFVIVGEVKNRSQKEYRFAQIEFNLYDSGNAQIGTATDTIRNLEANGTWKFRAMALREHAASAKFKSLVGR